MYFIILFLYSSLSFGVCNQSIDFPLDNFIKNLAPIVEKPWAAASDEQILSHTCQKKVPNLIQMQTHLKSKKNLSVSLDLLLNKNATSFDDEIKTDLKAYAAQNCEDELCIAKKVFGEEEGVKLLYMIDMYGLNGSHIVHKEALPWTSQGLTPYLSGLAAIPDFMLPIKKNQQFTKTNKKPKSIADASIMFYGGIDEFNQERIAYTTFHEIAHYISGSLHTEDDSDWFKASDWIEKKSFSDLPALSTTINFSNSISSTNSLLNSTTKKPSMFSSLGKKPESTSRFDIGSKETENKIKRMKTLLTGMTNTEEERVISRYGQVNPLEDIAESITAYRFNPQKLKDLSPKRYLYLKEKIFLGVEYLTEQNCASTSSKREEFLKLIKNP